MPYIPPLPADMAAPAPKVLPNLSIAEVQPSYPPSPRTGTTSTPSSAGASTGDAGLDLLWDQTYLRITYLVSTMGPAASSSAGPPTPPPAEAPDEEQPNPPAGARGWTAAPRDKARRKVAQIGAWRDEVGRAGAGAFCACSAAPSPPPSPEDGRWPLLCSPCGRPLAPPLPPAREPRGVRGALRGFLGRRRRADGAEAVRLEAPPPLRTEMYRADLPPAPGRRWPEAEVEEDEEVDPDALSGSDSSSRPALLPGASKRQAAAAARLARAQRLLARSHEPAGGGELGPLR